MGCLHKTDSYLALALLLAVLHGGPVLAKQAPPSPLFEDPGLESAHRGYVLQASWRTRASTFIGLGQLGLRQNEAHRFYGVLQHSFFGNQVTRSFLGAAQLGVLNQSGWFFGFAQLGAANQTRKQFAGLLQAGGYTINLGTAFAVIQVGGVNRSLAYHSGALQLGGLNWLEQGEFYGGLQVGVFNYLTSEASDGFYGLAQLGMMNDLKCDFFGVVQVGVISTVKGRFVGLAQVGGFNAAVHFTGLGQVGALNYIKDEVDGLQIGLLNVALGRVYGAQIGLFNYARRLRGLQIGLVNMSKDGGLPLMVLVNAGF